jgi:hypothetical protein
MTIFFFVVLILILILVLVLVSFFLGHRAPITDNTRNAPL